ncbi:MAG: hydrogenase maturation nickel metallochaperone HypA [Bacilli bacterium]|nr:hydrogenase maturation nickel metallochaperone HypA [Bacilli bacterium]
MHELPLVKSLFNQVIEVANKNHAKKVTLVVLEMGKLRDFVPEIVQKYWDYVIPGTIMEGSKIIIEEKEATLKCDGCGHIYLLDPVNLYENKCPRCECDTGELITGRELRIRGIEIE